MLQNKLTTKEFWVHNENGVNFVRHTNHGIDALIKKYIPATTEGCCIEIGSYPGPFLSTFGDLGYTLNGIDFHPDNTKGLPSWLQSLQYKTDQFLCVDFFDFKPTQKYDVVASFGFIEHFVNFESVIATHNALVKENGYLIITTPNFKGRIQYWLHKNFDKQNLALHNTESMNPLKWKKQLEDDGFEIIYYGYFGDFWFWHAPEKLSSFRRKMLWFIDRTVPRIRKVLWFQSPGFSAYAGIVAKKKMVK